MKHRPNILWTGLARNIRGIFLLIALLSTSHGAFARELHRHFEMPACTTEVGPIGADGINLTGRIRLHGNVPDGIYSTTVVMGVGADGDQRQFAWQVTNGVSEPLNGYPETGFIEDVQNGAIPG